MRVEDQQHVAPRFVQQGNQRVGEKFLYDFKPARRRISHLGAPADHQPYARRR